MRTSKDPGDQHRLTPEQREEAVRRYRAGERTTDLARDYGVSGPAIGSLVRTRKVALRGCEPPSIERGWINAEEAARLLGVSRTRVRQLVQAGALAPCWPTGSADGGSRVYFLESDVLTLQESRPVTPRQKRAQELRRWAEMTERYLAGEAAADVAADYSMTASGVLCGLKVRGIPIRSASDAARRYELDEGAFAAIASEAQAYWLGFLAADGYLWEGQEPSLVLSLVASDYAHLVWFRGFIGTAKPIYLIHGKGSPNQQCRFSLASRKLVADLMRHGLSQAKTFTVRWPALQPELMRHFLRGYFDGDGSWHCRLNRLQWSIVGNEAFLLACREWIALQIECGTPALGRKTNSHASIRYLRYSGNRQLGRLYELLYHEANVYLPRKRLIAACHFARNSRG